MISLSTFYHDLYEKYGPQGWWPIVSARKSDGGGLCARGYHPKDYTLPCCDRDRFEISVGAVLTQNTAWTNVEKALDNLEGAGAIDAAAMTKTELLDLAALVKPAGYYNQKAKKLKILASFFHENLGRTPSREALLALWGIGKETADSILLYAYHQPVFVVDTYTRRIMASLGHCAPDASYDDLQRIFMQELPHDVAVFQEYHALIVAHGKELSGRKGTST